MELKHIAIFPGNCETLRKLGRMGMSFNDVVSELIKSRVQTAGKPFLSDNVEKIRSEQRRPNHTQTVSSPADWQDA